MHREVPAAAALVPDPSQLTTYHPNWAESVKNVRISGILVFLIRDEATCAANEQQQWSDSAA